MALAGKSVVKGSAEVAEQVARAMAILSDSSDGQAKLLACGAAPALVALAGEGVVMSCGYAVRRVAQALYSLASSVEARAACKVAGASAALEALGRAAAVAASADAAHSVRVAAAALQGRRVSHEHALQLGAAHPGTHCCDLCGRSVEIAEAFSCATCDYDECPTCNARNK